MLGYINAEEISFWSSGIKSLYKLTFRGEMTYKMVKCFLVFKRVFEDMMELMKQLLNCFCWDIHWLTYLICEPRSWCILKDIELLTRNSGPGFSSSVYRRMKPLLRTLYLLGMLVPGGLGYDRWVWRFRLSKWKVFSRSIAARFSLLPMYAHHHDMRIIVITGVLSWKITLLILQ